MGNSVNKWGKLAKDAWGKQTLKGAIKAQADDTTVLGQLIKGDKKMGNSAWAGGRNKKLQDEILDGKKKKKKEKLIAGHPEVPEPKPLGFLDKLLSSKKNSKRKMADFQKLV